MSWKKKNSYRVINTSHGFTLIRKRKIFGSKYAFLNEDGVQICDFIYDFAYDFIDGFACVKRNGKFCLINEQGQEICPPIYDFIDRFDDGFAYAKLSGFIDEQGNFHITEPPESDNS